MRGNKRHAEFEFRATVRGLLSASAQHWNRALLALLGAVALAALSSCKKSAPRESAEERAHPSPNSNNQSEVIARAHWLGKKRIAADTNAAYFMKIWNLPETLMLEAQTLDKLSTAPWRLLQSITNTAPLSPGSQPSTNDSQSAAQSPTIGSSALLRPLLDDLVQQEWYVEVRQTTNQPGEAALAIRLDAARAALWETNLAAVLESLTDSRVISAQSGRPGWRLPITHHASRSANSSPSAAPSPQRSNTETLQPSTSPSFSTNYLELARAGEWTLISLAQEHNALLGDLLARIQPRPSTERRGTPFALRTANFWLEADLDLRRLARAYAPGWTLPENSPRIALTIMGDGEYVRTRGGLTFANSLGLGLEHWTIPTNTIREPLISFTAVQGLAPLQQTVERFSGLKLEHMPTQGYLWALRQIPFQTFLAAAVPDATNVLRSLGPQIVEWAEPKLPENTGSIIMATNVCGLVWTGVPFATPYLLPLLDSGQEFLLAGMFPNTTRTNGLPPDLFAQITERTNLLYYDWEITQHRLLQWRHLDDLCHIVFDASHKPRLRADSVGVRWLGSIAANLGNSVSEITLADSNQLKFVRQSHIGLTGFELELVVNWLESSDFPCGFHDPRSPSPTRPLQRKNTVSPSPSPSRQSAGSQPSK